MWVIPRGSDHSRHALLIMLCISAVHLNRELATTQCLHCSSPLLWCSQGRGKKVASGLSDLISSLMAWKDFIEVQIDCVPMQVVDWGQKLMPVKMPWLNSILLAPYSLSLYWRWAASSDTNWGYEIKSRRQETRQVDFGQSQVRQSCKMFCHSRQLFLYIYVPATRFLIVWKKQKCIILF